MLLNTPKPVTFHHESMNALSDLGLILVPGQTDLATNNVRHKSGCEVTTEHDTI